MKPQSLEEAQKLDLFVSKLIETGSQVYMNYTKVESLGLSRDEYNDFVVILKEEFSRAVDFKFGAQSFFVTEITPIERFLREGGFTARYNESDLMRKDEIARQELEKRQKSLQIKSLEESLRYSREARRKSRIALIVSVVVAILTVVKWIFDLISKNYQ